MGLSHLGLRAASRPFIVGLVERLGRRGAVSQGDSRRPAIALTFDDGPHPIWTPQVLDRLDEAGARATFFVSGRNVERHPELVRDASRRGHEIGIHLFSHDRRTVYDSALFDAELRRCQAQIVSLLGEPARFLRFPYGNPGLQQPKAVLQSHGVRAVHWTFSSHDGSARSPKEIVDRVAAGLRPGAIVLFHDALADEGPSLPAPYRAERDVTVAALPQVLAGARARGLSAVTLTTLLAPPGAAR